MPPSRPLLGFVRISSVQHKTMSECDHASTTPWLSNPRSRFFLTVMTTKLTTITSRNWWLVLQDCHTPCTIHDFNATNCRLQANIFELTSYEQKENSNVDKFHSYSDPNYTQLQVKPLTTHTPSSSMLTWQFLIQNFMSTWNICIIIRSIKRVRWKYQIWISHVASKGRVWLSFVSWSMGHQISGAGGDHCLESQTWWHEWYNPSTYQETQDCLLQQRIELNMGGQ